MDHFKTRHDISVEVEIKKFKSFDDFNLWKSAEEKRTKSSFVNKHGSYATSNYVKKLYECHRSGKYISEGSGLRHLKTQGSNKIGAFCPAAITLTVEEEMYKISYIKTHVGHDNDLGHLFLNKEDREEVASKIAAKIPLPTILDDIRDTICSSNFERLHLITKKDLYNIEQTYNLNATSVRHKDDAISVDSWVNEVQDSNCVVLYKPQGVTSDEHVHLKKGDFVLIIMTDGQKEILEKFGNDCVCIDGTHGLNSYGFELITLLVLDDMREGFPTAFMISNRSDEEVLYIFFACIEKRLGFKLASNVFMSDMAEAFFNAWLRVMYPPKYR